MPDFEDAYLPKDFIETAEGLVFAVVQAGTEKTPESHKVLAFLRYIRSGENNQWQKMNTVSANRYLLTTHPHYLHHSSLADADVHGVDPGRIIKHHKPQVRLRQILSKQYPDAVERDLVQLCQLFQESGVEISKMGVTGSLLIGAQKTGSDIDLVICERELFHRLRKLTEELTAKGKLDAFTEKDWRDAYVRRECALSFEEYVWHERRKFNKGLINVRKFDLNFINTKVSCPAAAYQKQGKINLKARISGDRYAFDYPAVFQLDHHEINQAVCFTATYTGQAFLGETVEISGLLEQSGDGAKRIVVGTSREAQGEYIKVVQCLV